MPRLGARRRDGDAEEVLVPFVRASVPEVDVPGGRVVVTPPPGLFEELPADEEAAPAADEGDDTP